MGEYGGCQGVSISLAFFPVEHLPYPPPFLSFLLDFFFSFLYCYMVSAPINTFFEQCLNISFLKKYIYLNDFQILECNKIYSIGYIINDHNRKHNSKS